MTKADRTKLNLFDLIGIGAAVLATVGLLIFALVKFPTSGGTAVEVYYKNRLIDTYDLTRDRIVTFCRDEVKEAEGFVCDASGMGDFQGPIIQLEIKGKAIRITEETSSKKLCSYQGSISWANTPLVCLPNSFSAVIVGDSEPEFDA